MELIDFRPMSAADVDREMEVFPLGPALDIEDAAVDHDVPSDIDLHNLALDSEPVHSITHLIAEKGASRDLDRFKRQVLALRTTDTQTLIVRIASTTDPLMLWSIHATLEKRGIQPCLRWPAKTDTAQSTFITWLADMAWFQRRNPDHVPKSKASIQLFKQEVDSVKWREKAYWMFKNTYGKRSLARASARALALTLLQRQELMMCPTTAIVAKRRELHPARFDETRGILLSHAVAHPDKSGTISPDASARRWARLWRIYILSGKSPTVTVKNWELLTGKSITRQAIAKQITTIETVLKDRRAECDA